MIGKYTSYGGYFKAMTVSSVQALGMGKASYLKDWLSHFLQKLNTFFDQLETSAILQM